MFEKRGVMGIAVMFVFIITIIILIYSLILLISSTGKLQTEAALLNKTLETNSRSFLKEEGATPPNNFMGMIPMIFALLIIAFIIFYYKGMLRSLINFKKK